MQTPSNPNGVSSQILRQGITHANFYGDKSSRVDDSKQNSDLTLITNHGMMLPLLEPVTEPKPFQNRFKVQLKVEYLHPDSVNDTNVLI